MTDMTLLKEEEEGGRRLPKLMEKIGFETTALTSFFFLSVLAVGVEVVITKVNAPIKIGAII